MVIQKKAIENEAVIKKISKLLFNLDIDYINISHYILALIHRSIVNERPDFTPEHNERLEFLGDAVLELVVTDNLYLNFPEKPEGELTDIRSALVRGRNLALVAKKLGISEYLLLGKGEEKGGGRENEYILANTVEALIGAIYIDLGFKAAREFIEKNIYSSLKSILNTNNIKDYKTTIQEYAQAEFDVTPTYQVIKEEGLDHEKLFTVGIFFGEKLIAMGDGSSKKKAQEKSAENAYNTLLENKN